MKKYGKIKVNKPQCLPSKGNEHVYFRNRLGSIFMAVAQVALAEPERFPERSSCFQACNWQN